MEIRGGNKIEIKSKWRHIQRKKTVSRRGMPGRCETSKLFCTGDEDVEEGEGQNNNSGQSDEAPPKEDDDFSPEDGRKKTKWKKRKARGEEKKSRKKMKKLQNESEEEHEFGLKVKAEGAPSPGPSSKGRGSKHNTSSSVPSDSGPGMPTVEEVCASFGLTDVDVRYSESDLKNLTSYTSFRQRVLPLLVEANPKVFLMLKLMMLVAAKWRLFSKTNPHYLEGGSSTQNLGLEGNTNSSTASDFAPKRPGCAPKDTKPQPKKKAKTKIGNNTRKKKDYCEEVGEESSRGANSDSDAEFELTLAETTEPKPTSSNVKDSAQPNEDDPNAPRQPKMKAKPIIGNNTRKKEKLRSSDNFPDGAQGEQENQDYCEVCKKGLKGTRCDTCPRIYHWMCFKRELGISSSSSSSSSSDSSEHGAWSTLPERRWSCPCKAEGNRDQYDDEHQDICGICKNGLQLVLCDSCPSAYHRFCLDPPLERVPDAEWYCPRCSPQPKMKAKPKIVNNTRKETLRSSDKFPDGAQGEQENQDYCERPPLDVKVEKILSWRWREPSANSRAPRSREYFVKWRERSYWHCSWISEIQPLMYRSFMHELEYGEKREGREGLQDLLDWERLDADQEMLQKYYRYGVKPEWLQVHRVIHHVTSRDSTTRYMVKWRDLPYNQATWESEHEHIAGFKNAIEYYQDMRAHITSKGKSKGSKGKKGCKSKNKGNVDDESSSGLQVKARKYMPPPDRPITDPNTKYEDQPPFARETGMQLYPHQLEGLNWLRYSWGNGIDTILADEMGLGKTIQSVAFLYSLFKEGHSKGPFLVVVPCSAITDWEREFELWAPDLYVVTNGRDKESRAVIRENELTYDDGANRGGRPSIVNSQVKFNVLLTSNELISIDETFLGSIDWAVLVVDVPHRLKSSESKYFRLLAGYHINYKLLLTGTPLQNNLKELFHLLNFLNKDKFCDLAAFQNEFADVSKEEQEKRLHEMLGPHMLQRLKADVLKNMPTKSEFIVRVQLSPMQKKYYKYILTRNYNNLKPNTCTAMDLGFVMDELKKCCNHPFLFPVAAEEAPLGPHGTYDTQALIKASGKLALMSKMLRQLKEQGHKVLIFSENKKMLDILEEFLLGESYKYERIDGDSDLPGAIRRKAIDRFNAPDAQQFVFLMWSKANAACLGINLATADTVIIYDCYWNSHSDIQAYSRAHRIGLVNKGMIYRFVTRKSLEERITQVAERKMMLTHLAVRPGMGGKGAKFTKKELDDILRFGTEELFKEEEDKEEDIHYDDKAVGDILAWSKEGIEQKEYWANEYLSSFKVANYSTKGETENEVDTEIINQEAENTDLAYWIKLLRHRYKKYVEEKNSTLGKSKRIRNVVYYSEC